MKKYLSICPASRRAKMILKQIFDEILGKWEHNEQLLKDKSIVPANPFIMALKTIELKWFKKILILSDGIIYCTD